MKILVLTNFYPPYSIGGMEITCKAVVDGLTDLGNQCLVLTSYHGLDRPTIQDGIARLLHLEMSLTPLNNAINFFIDREKHKTENRVAVNDRIQDFNPDVAFVWGMWNLHRILALDTEKIMNGRVLYRFGDYWPTLPSQYLLYWDRPGKSLPTRIIRRLIRPVAMRTLMKEQSIHLALPNSYCISQAVKSQLIDLGVPVQNASVIYNGLHLTDFSQLPKNPV